MLSLRIPRHGYVNIFSTEYILRKKLIERDNSNPQTRDRTYRSYGEMSLQLVSCSTGQSVKPIKAYLQ